MKRNGGNSRNRSLSWMFITMGLCGFFYILGVWHRSGFGKGDSIALEITRQMDCSVVADLYYETHRGGEAVSFDDSGSDVKLFEPCDGRYVNHVPCHDETISNNFPRIDMVYVERHCPSKEDKLDCLIPAPEGYVTPFSWPKSLEYVSRVNLPYKGEQKWIENGDDVFRFSEGGFHFPHGVDTYIDELASVIPFGDGRIRTALDIGCGIATWGAHMFKKNVITMSFAPKNPDMEYAQFALERGVPAVIGVLGTMKLPYPGRSFDIIHCSHCWVSWGASSEMYMMEVHRLLRPGGYWVMSGSPANSMDDLESSDRPVVEPQDEQRRIEGSALLLRWEKKHKKGDISIWRKTKNIDDTCVLNCFPNACDFTNEDDVWYKKMESCISPCVKRTRCDEEVMSKKWKPLSSDGVVDVPNRISSGSIPGVSAEEFERDGRLWRKHVEAYKRFNNIIDSGRYRNIMDMNAGFGGFAAALRSPKLWVMNVVPTIAERDTLGAVYERGFIGIYHDWCEAFSTYPRTYDLIHADGIFSMYKDKCGAEEILVEMDRILRPEGAVILREEREVLVGVRRIIRRMRWESFLEDSEDGPLEPHKMLFALKPYSLSSPENPTSSF